MNITDIIIKKRNGFELTADEINYAVTEFVKGTVADYQMSALLMTFYFNNLTENEIFALTEVMKNSGKILDLSDIVGVKVDKHSSGGVGDKISLIVGPIAAAAGVKVAKMSGRGLGFTGGTIDKLEAISGFKTDMSEEAFKNQVKDIGMCIIGQTEDIAKADKLIYALRDVTGTVDIPGLIASSIMSKKLAMGSDCMVLDVKYGKGALMKTYDDAKDLGNMMKKIGEKAGKTVEIVLSAMEQPLGNAVGNANEIEEAIETLKGKGPVDLTELAVSIAGKMIYLGKQAVSEKAGEETAREIIADGRGLKKFKEFVEAQGGNSDIADDYSLLPKPQFTYTIKGEELLEGDKNKITKLDAEAVGKASLVCGAGRHSKKDKPDLSAGITLYKKVGDTVEPKDIVATIYGSDETKVKEGKDKLKEAYAFD